VGRKNERNWPKTFWNSLKKGRGTRKKKRKDTDVVLGDQQEKRTAEKKNIRYVLKSADSCSRWYGSRLELTSSQTPAQRGKESNTQKRKSQMATEKGKGFKKKKALRGNSKRSNKGGSRTLKEKNQTVFGRERGDRVGREAVGRGRGRGKSTGEGGGQMGEARKKREKPSDIAEGKSRGGGQGKWLGRNFCETYSG